MALNFPITFSLAPLPTGLALTGDEYAAMIVANLQATISGDFLTGQIGGNPPTQNVGPWANNGQWYFWDESLGSYVQQTFASFTLPSGLIFPYGGVAAPSGFLICDGAAVSRATFNNLFVAITTIYGAGDGATTFNLPNLSGRIPVMQGASGNGNTYAIGSLIGEDLHTLSTAELAAHNHVINTVNPAHNHTASGTSNPHTHSYITSTTITTAAGGGGQFSYIPEAGITGTQSDAGVAVTVNNQTTAVTATSVNTGSGTGHNIVQSGLVTNFIIKT